MPRTNLGVGLLLLIPAGGCANSLECANSIIQVVPSPDKSMKAVLFERDCGATTGCGTDVSVLPAQESLGNQAGNAFIADDNHGAAPTGKGGGPNVWVKWLSRDRIKIGFDHRAQVFVRNKFVGKTSIVIEAK